MFVEKLEIFGFKSFGQKLELTFGNGISGVIGPNGCGKSNLVDAFRWVLGEQSSRTLRGDKMEDIIFNGTRDMKPLSMAEVNLTLRNDRGVLPSEYTTVSVGRRLYRSGQSEYTINRQPCRLKDVKELFLDTGMGSHAYSVIERGMVDNVLSDNTGHRRFLFEEASGIMKYKTRKKEALTKLEATQTDLIRLSDILSEVDKAVDSLKRQVGKAQRYRDLRDRLKSVELAHAQGRIRELRERLDQLRVSGERLALEEHEAQARLTGAEARLETLKLQQTDAERGLATARELLAGLDARITDLNHEVVVIREREEATRQRVQAAREQIERLALRREENSVDLERAEEALATHEGALTGYRETLVGQERFFKDLDQRVRAQREEVNRRKQLSLDLFQEKMRREGDLRHCMAELEQLETARRELDEERGNIVTRRGELAARVTEGQERVHGLAQSIETAQVAIAELTGRISGLDGALREAQADEGRLRELVAGVDSSLATLRNLRTNYEGFDPGVKRIMLARGQDPTVLGTVADLVRVPGEWVEALRPALAGVLQQVVLRHAAAAPALLAELEAEQAGFVTFLALDRLPVVDGDSHHLLPHHPDIIAPARNLVQAPPELRALVDHFLGDVLVVRDVMAGLRLADDEAWRRFRFVTPEGALIAGPTVAGGRGGDTSGDLLAREREIEGLVARLADLGGQLATREAARRDMELNREAAALELEGRREEAVRLNGERAALQTEMGRLEGELRALEAREADLELRDNGLSARKVALLDSREKLEGVVTNVTTDSSSAENAYRELEGALAALETEREGALDRVNESRVTVARAESSVSEARERIERMRAIAREIEADDQRCINEVTEGDERLLRLAAERETLAAQVEELHAGRDGHVDAVAERERIHSDLGQEVSLAEGVARDARRGANDLRNQAHGEEIQVTELRGRFETLAARLYEDYDLTTDALLTMGLDWPLDEEGQPLPLDLVEATVTDLKERIKRLGPVNLLAIEEYEEKSTRQVFLSAQVEDLTKAREQLLETITQDQRHGGAALQRDVQQGAGELPAHFQALFQGGECSLTLVGDDPLECEIEIVAKPTGKKPQSISQLSSGERALTAIALLFAIYLVKPSPFCILDEVDAPLDDANVDRFVAMLREFSDRTQFIVITHNKKTMEAADSLYGVTMARTGRVEARLGAPVGCRRGAREQADAGQRRAEAARDAGGRGRGRGSGAGARGGGAFAGRRCGRG